MLNGTSLAPGSVAGLECSRVGRTVGTDTQDKNKLEQVWEVF